LAEAEQALLHHQLLQDRPGQILYLALLHLPVAEVAEVVINPTLLITLRLVVLVVEHMVNLRVALAIHLLFLHLKATTVE
jgi:hypothetical protein